jgi:haloalkane dehalogenase
MQGTYQEASGSNPELWGTADTIFKSDSPGYLNRLFPNSRGVRYIEGARLFWPEEFPDILAEEARKLWGV